MKKYEEPIMEVVFLHEMGDVITLSVGETDPSNGEQWWGQ